MLTTSGPRVKRKTSFAEQRSNAGRLKATEPAGRGSPKYAGDATLIPGPYAGQQRRVADTPERETYHFYRFHPGPERRETVPAPLSPGPTYSAPPFLPRAEARGIHSGGVTF